MNTFVKALLHAYVKITSSLSWTLTTESLWLVTMVIRKALSQFLSGVCLQRRISICRISIHYSSYSPFVKYPCMKYFKILKDKLLKNGPAVMASANMCMIRY